MNPLPIVRLIVLLAGVLAWSLPVSRAQTSYPAGEPLMGAGGPTLRLTSTANAAATEVDVAGPGFARAWRLETRADLSPAWATEFKAPVTRSVARNDVALLRFYARAVATSDESGSAFFRLVVQKASPEWDKSFEGTHSVGREWQEFLFPFAFGADYAANAVEVAFGLGFKRQTIEIGGIDFVYYGTRVPLPSLPRTRLSYAGREPGAAWRTAALARIEQIRKGDVVVQVVDPAGQPVRAADVRIEQRSSAFHFGSALQMSRIVGDTADNRRYRQKVLELFNAVSTENDLKWGAWAGEWGTAYSQPQTLAGLTWLRNHGLHVRGHVLVWPGWNNLPASIRNLRGTAAQGEIPQRALAHIADIVTATRHLVQEWDVLNEPYANHDLMDLFGAAIQADWFKAARAAHPTAPLYLNDYGNHDAGREAAHVAHFESTARYLKEQGAPLGGLGVQAHIGGSPSPPANILSVLDRYAALQLPVRVTEFDINSEDEELQADYTRDFLIAMYSHASVVGVQLWGFWEGAHWIPRAAMYRRDWSEKPNARAYKALVLDEWRTRASGTTDAQGAWRGRGFHGDYVAIVQVGGRRYEQVFTLAAGTPLTTVRVPLVAARVSNLSTRAHAGADGATLIPGFFVEGPSPRAVLIRAVGPGLRSFGLDGVLAQPELTLRRQNDDSIIATNRGWDDGAAADRAVLATTMARLGAFPLTAGSGDCAMLVTLAPGGYTAPVTARNGGAGVAIVEAYEADANGAGRLKNLSARARVTAGNTAISGLVTTGENARTVLVRAIGPGLRAFGLNDALARPVLVLRRGEMAVAANSGWETAADPDALVAASTRAGAFALRAGESDAALLATLPAGQWTVEASGASGAEGVVLIEAYDLSDGG